MLDPDLYDNLELGRDGGKTSSYSMYRIWLASLSLHCGWEIECDNLRIPSTRNWAIAGELVHDIALLLCLLYMFNRQEKDTEGPRM